jgi:hypothetical protein
MIIVADLMKYLALIFVIIAFNLSLRAQESLGIVNSNYAGVHGIGLNPSSMVGSKLYMDYNLLTLNLSFDNNYFHLLRDDWYNLLFHNITPIYYTEEGEVRNFRVYRNDKDKEGYAGIRILGPSGMIVAGKHAFGLTTAFRLNTSFANLPPEMATFIYEAIDYEKLHNFRYVHDKPIRAGAMNWLELGFSYAYNFHRYAWKSWSAGITIKPLFGMNSTHANLYTLDYTVYNDTTAQVFDVTFDYAYSLPMDYSTNDFPDGPLFKGFGIGVDLGVTYMYTKKGHTNMAFGSLCEQPYEEYNYRIGISLLDVGFIRFKKKAFYRKFVNTATYWYEPYDTLPGNSVNEINEKIDFYFLDNAEDLIEEESYTMNLPPALSLQFDYPLKRYLFFNITGIYGFNLGKGFLKRPSILAFTPRYETNRMEVSVPISVYEWFWRSPRVGFYFRYGNFFFGFDKLNTALGLNDFTGIDFYIGLKLNLSNTFRMNYIKGFCNDKRFGDIETFDYRNF